MKLKSGHLELRFSVDSNTQKIENMNDSFRFYTDSTIYNRALTLPVNLLWTETHSFMYLFDAQ